eukprot:TRINITY_DN787_c0_g1_i8.p1 TRINITY_DN787_c0_g1~~TRINITY_DN787_c0_g1_i8.p1  ORF type:complete len:464 (+),score=125.20 TRINITY_DN787_c0_g1_i8:423-1814(+)
MKPYQKVNHFPNMSCLARKNCLGRNLARMRRAFRRDYSFFPSTWALPAQRKELQEEIARDGGKTYIVKPEALSQGKGIFLTRTLAKVPHNERCVVQRYIKKPYLIEGLKFDLRIYVLVYGCDPLRVYIFKEGLARLATEKYVHPTRANLNNHYMHLTNYAINKNSRKFVFNADADNPNVGHKRSLEFVWKHVDANGGDSHSLRRKIRRAIVKTLCAVQPQLRQYLSSCQPLNYENSSCFEILGFDILLDHKLKPWLLEVNSTPSFCTDTPFDNRVKTKLIADTLKILNVTPERKLEYVKRELERRNARAYNRLLLHPSKEEREALKLAAMEHRDTYELAHCGDFTRAYPDKKLNAKYQTFIDYAAQALDASCGVHRPEPRDCVDSARKSSVAARPKTVKSGKGLNEEAVKEKLGVRLYSALKARSANERSVLVDKKDAGNREDLTETKFDASGLLKKYKKDNG